MPYTTPASTSSSGSNSKGGGDNNSRGDSYSDAAHKKDKSVIDQLLAGLKSALGVANHGIEVTGQAIKTSAEVVGVNMQQIENNMNKIKKFAKEGTSESARALAKANRLAKRRIDTDSESGLKISDYYQILTCTGSGDLGPGQEKKIQAGQQACIRSFTVPGGHTVVWKAQVKTADILFFVREAGESGRDDAKELIPDTRYVNGTLYEGTLPAVEYSRRVEFMFDNTSDKDKSRFVVFWVDCGVNATLDNADVVRSLEYKLADGGPEEVEEEKQ